MTVRGGGIPRRPLALTPNGRMGPPLRSFAADAHDCIMVRVLGPTGYKVVARLNSAPKAGSPLIVIATALSVPSCSKHEGKRCAALANSLTKKAPYKGLGADSEEKREPASDIETAEVDSLKVLDPEWPIREADIEQTSPNDRV